MDKPARSQTGLRAGVSLCAIVSRATGSAGPSGVRTACVSSWTAVQTAAHHLPNCVAAGSHCLGYLELCPNGTDTARNLGWHHCLFHVYVSRRLLLVLRRGWIAV